MRVIWKSVLVGSYFVCVSLGLSLAAYSQSQPAKLVLNRIIKSEIKGGETQVFSVSLLADQTARIEIVQNGVDVSLTAIDPKNQTYIRTESPSGYFGDDLILVTASETGEYKVTVTPANPRAKLGKYTILLSKIRKTVAEDFEINKAAERVEKLANEAYRLKYNGTVKGRREALIKWREATELSKVKKDKVWEGITLVESGLIYEQLGELQNALDVQVLSLEIWKEIKNRQYEGSALNNIAIIYNSFGEYGKGISYLKEAIKIQREIGNRRSEGIFLNNLAYAYMKQTKYVRAEVLFRQALLIKKEDGSVRGRRSLSATLHNLGTTLAKNGELSKGVEFLEQSLELRRKLNYRWGVANSLLMIGRLQWEASEKEKAFTNLSDVNLSSKKLGDRRMEAESFYLLAVIEQDRGNILKAIENVSSGLDIIEQIRNELIGSRSQYAYFSTVQNYYELYVDLLISRFEKTKNQEDMSLALEISERSRSRSLIDLLREAKVKFRQGIDADLLAKEKSLREELNNKYQIRQKLLSGKKNPAKIAIITSEINSFSLQFQAVETKIRRQNSRYSDLTGGKTLLAKEIQNLLDDKTVILEYKLGEKRSFVWLITKDSIEISILPPRKEIEKKAKAFYDLVISNKKRDKSKRLERSKDLGKTLFSSFRTEISGRRLAIIADGILQYTPFSALRVSNTNVLAESNEIVVLPSASVLAQIRKDTVRRLSAKKTIAVFADPVFDNKDSRISNLKQKPVALNDSLKAVFRGFEFGETLSRLLASRQEARNIANLVGKNQATLKTDFEANLESIEKADLSKYRVLHFATHGLLNTSNPELSGLVFSLYDKDGKSREGFLGLNDIFNLNLSSDMVVLSACQTALGKDVRGEGLIGLSRGFLYAGSKRIVASLWKVDDSATAEFMKRFYRNYLEKGLSASSALRQAKIEMKKIPRYKAPFYWSAFTLLGEWK